MINMGDTRWQPGQSLSLDSPLLSIRTLRQADLEGNIQEWMGSTKRTTHVWKPPIPPRDYLRGLIGACDQKSRFAFGIFLRQSGELIGYRKSQVATESEGKVVVPTTVIGDKWARHGYGRISGELHNWFFVNYLGVAGIKARIYEDNTIVCQLAEQCGYQLVETLSENIPGSSSRKVRCYFQTAEQVLAHSQGKDFAISTAASFSSE